MTKQLIIMNVGILVATVIAFVFFTRRAKLKEQGQYDLARKRKLHNRFAIYFNNLLLRNRFRRIVATFSTLSCYDTDQMKEQSVQLFERSIVTAAIIPIVTLITLRDVTITLLTITVAYIYYNNTIEKQVDKIYSDVMKESSLAIQSISDGYQGCNNIPQSVLYADKCTLLHTPINAIYEILTDVDGKERLHEFQHLYPVRIIKTLGNVCYIVNEDGDTREEDGSSAFVKDLSALRQECDAEVRRLEKTRIAFKSLAMLSLVGIFLLPVEYLYLSTQIPGTVLLLKGLYGMIMEAAIVLSTVVAYYIISIINRPTVVNQVDKVQIIDDYSKQKKVRDFISQIIPKKSRTRSKLYALIRDSISSKDLYYIYTSKVIYSVIAFVAVNIVLVLFTIVARSNIYNNYGSLGFIPAQEMTEDAYRGVVRVDDQLMALSDKDFHDYTESDLSNLYKGNIRGLSDLAAMDHADRITTKYETYAGLHFHWWFILIAYLGAIGAWRIPELSLMLRKYLVEYEATEDVLQLQTMMIVLSNTKYDVLKALYWLEKQSTIHSAPLRYAYHEYTSDPLGALETLKGCSANLDFKRLVNKLQSAVYTLSIHDSFSDVFLDKQQSLTMREMLQGEQLESKKNWAKMIAIVPPALSLIGMFILPILILGIRQLTDSLALYNPG